MPTTRHERTDTVTKGAVIAEPGSRRSNSALQGGTRSSFPRRWFLAPLAFATFATIYSGALIGPLVTQLATQFHTLPGSVGLASAAYSLPGIVVGAIAGPFSDRYGRRRFLLFGTVVTGIFTAAAALAPTLLIFIVMRSIAGLAAALVLPNMMAAVADRFAHTERGPAVATIFGANTLGTIAGISGAGIIANYFGWRISVAVAGALLICSAAGVAAVRFPWNSSGRSPSIINVYRTVLTDRSAVILLLSNLLGVAAWGTWGTYIVAFFQHTYSTGLGTASVYSVVLGLGMLVGSQIGGRLFRGSRQTLILACGLCCFGASVLIVTAAGLPLEIAIALSLAGAIGFGLRATANANVMTQQVPQARATLLAMSAATVAAGTVFGTGIGGTVLDALGFAALGSFCLAIAVISAGTALLFVREFGGATTQSVASRTGRYD